MDKVRDGQTYRYCDVCGKHHIELGINISAFGVHCKSMGYNFDMFNNLTDFHMETHSCSEECCDKAKQLLKERWNHFMKNEPEAYFKYFTESWNRKEDRSRDREALLEIFDQIFDNGFGNIDYKKYNAALDVLTRKVTNTTLPEDKYLEGLNKEQ